MRGLVVGDIERAPLRRIGPLAPARDQAGTYQFGATDVIEERGDDAMVRIKDMTGGLGVHSVIEAVGTRESMLQAIGSARPGGHVGYVGVTHGELLGGALFFGHAHLHGGPAPVRQFLPQLIELISDGAIEPGQGVRPHRSPGRRGRGIPGDGRTPRCQDPPHRLPSEARMTVIYDFAGQGAFVTGAASGMGLATAEAFARCGAAVSLTDRGTDGAVAAAGTLRAQGRTAVGIGCDVSSGDDVAAAIATTVDTFGRLDMAFNNAGIMIPRCDAVDERIEQFERVNDVNLRGVWASMKHELVQMRAQGSGAIVNCSRRPRRASWTRYLPRHQTPRHRVHPQRGPRVRIPRRAHQYHLPRHQRHADGHRIDGRRRAKRRRSGVLLARRGHYVDDVADSTGVRGASSVVVG